MIVIKIEMWPGGSQQGKYQLGEMHITNKGTGDFVSRDYIAEVMRKPDFNKVTRETHIDKWPSERLTIWHLVARALQKMGYT